MFGPTYFPTGYFAGTYFPPATEGSLSAYIALWFELTPVISGYYNMSATVPVTFSGTGTLDGIDAPAAPIDVHVGNPGGPARKRRRKPRRRQETAEELLRAALFKARQEGRLRPVEALGHADPDAAITWLEEAEEAAQELKEQAVITPQPAFAARVPAFAPPERQPMTRQQIVDRIMEAALDLAESQLAQAKLDARAEAQEAERRRRRDEDDLLALLLLD